MKIVEVPSYENLSSAASVSETSSLNISDDFGIAPSHLIIMLKNAISNNIVSVWRPVNPEATKMLQEGDYTGKRIATKGKSSTFGPIAGEIPRNAYLSKSYSKFDQNDPQGREENVQKAQKLIDSETEKSTIALAEFKKNFTQLKQARNTIHGQANSNEDEKQDADLNLKTFVLENDGAEFSSVAKKITRLERIKDGEFAISYISDKDFNAAPASNSFIESPLHYYAAKENNKPLYNKNDKPIFFVIVDEKNYVYDYNSKTFTQNQLAIDHTKYEQKIVEITSYDMVSFDLKKLNNVDFKYKIRNMLVTADYDELVSCGQKIYPTFQSKDVNFRLSSEFHDSFLINRELRKAQGQAVSQSGLLSGGTENDNNDIVSSSRSKSKSSNGGKDSSGKIELDENNIPENVDQISFTRYIAENFLALEKRKYVEFSSKNYYEDMGSVTEIERNFKSFLAKNLDKATNHGPEINNPNPEGFASGAEDFLPVILPSAKIGEYVARRFIKNHHISLDVRYYGIEVDDKNFDAATVKLRGEKHLCFFVNIMHEIGYNLKIHPKWGWQLAKPEKHRIMTDLDGGKSRRRRTYFRELVCGRENPAYFDWEGFKVEFGKLKEKVDQYQSLDKEVRNKIDLEIDKEIELFNKAIEVKKSNKITEARNLVVEKFHRIDTLPSPRLRSIVKIIEDLDLEDNEGCIEYAVARYRLTIDRDLFKKWNKLSELLVAPGVNYAWGAAFNQSAARNFPDDIKKLEHLAAGERSLLTRQTMKIGRHISLRFEQWRFEEIQEILGDLKIRFKLLKTKSGEDSLVKVFYKEEEIYKDNKKDLQDSHSNSHSKRASKKKEESKSRGRG